MPPPLNSIQHSFGPNQKSVLIDELKLDDVLACLTSIHRLTTIALALGECTRHSVPTKHPWSEGLLPKNQGHLVTALIPVFCKLAADDQDLGCLLTVDVLIAIVSSLPDKAVCKQQLGSIMKAMVSDQSWRVRYMIADHFAQLSGSASEDVVWEELVRAFVHLLNDNEAEV
ncbi:uncharacterized protein VP01_9776g1 [Puccinia sorghi]|uniref:Uncharacterized protein n=1 Tax=Puccinia sorghi TaxID=27349 RepID=A0A0L6U5U0_9BASI|nr:uncharacterized protein VP01_9776g1 [Puccinia sorghi]